LHSQTLNREGSALKVILVDDEKGIVDGLKIVLKRYIPECEVIGEAHNGLDGFRLIQKRKPDIVITDIRMPQSDGLEMVKQLKDAGNTARVILLSGYADFEYARKGMQYGVQFYINKPVEEEELRDCLVQLMEAIRSDKARLQEVDDLRRNVQKRAQETALREIIDLSVDSSSHVEEMLQAVGIPAKGTSAVCVLLEFDQSLGTLNESVHEPIYRLIDRTFGQFRRVYRFRYLESQVAVVVTHDEAIKYGEVVHAVHRLKEALYREQKLAFTAGIGSVQERAAQISQSFEEARYALSYKVIKGADAVIPYLETVNLAGRRHHVPEELIERLESNLENMEEEGCVFVIREIFQGLSKERSISLAGLQMQCVNILLSSIRKMSFQQLQQHDFLGRHILSLEGISRFRTLDSLEKWMIQVIRDIIALMHERKIPKKKDIIAEVKAYLAEHYHEPIGLAELSARFFINPYYLSQLFKQRTGDTYMNYLAHIRISKAKELLVKSDLKVYEICQMVGYSDTQHFARLFEKLAGCKPSQYRKQYME
jgi:two-component system, response regulator YesN